MKIFLGVSCVLLILCAIIAFWANPVILVVAVGLGLLTIIIRERLFVRIIPRNKWQWAIFFTLVVLMMLCILPPLAKRAREYSRRLNYAESGKSLQYTYRVSFQVTGKRENGVLVLVEKLGVKNNIEPFLHGVASQFTDKSSLIIKKPIKEFFSRPEVEKELKTEGWSFTGMKFDKEDKVLWFSRSIPIKMKWYRPIFECFVDLPTELPLHPTNTDFVDIDENEVVLDMPKNMFRSSDPLKYEKKTVSDNYENIHIFLGDYPNQKLCLQLLSWPWYNSIFRAVFFKPVMWLFGLSIGMVGGLFRKRVEELLSSFMKAIFKKLYSRFGMKNRKRKKK